MALNMVWYVVAIAVGCLLTSQPLLLASVLLPEALFSTLRFRGSRMCISYSQNHIIGSYSALGMQHRLVSDGPLLTFEIAEGTSMRWNWHAVSIT